MTTRRADLNRRLLEARSPAEVASAMRALEAADAAEPRPVVVQKPSAAVRAAEAASLAERAITAFLAN